MNLNGRDFKVGDVVQHFKRTTLSDEELRTDLYLYQIIAVATHTENCEDLVIYRACYPDKNGEYRYFARPVEKFAGKVDKSEHPECKQEYRFVVVRRPSNCPFIYGRR